MRRTTTLESRSKRSLSKKIGIGIGVGVAVTVGGLVAEDILAPVLGRPSLLSRIVNRTRAGQGYEALLPER